MEARTRHTGTRPMIEGRSKLQAEGWLSASDVSVWERLESRPNMVAGPVREHA